MNQLMKLQDVAALIRAGRPLSVAGTEAALDRLPPGTWIGGTIPYFMLEGGGTVVGDDEVFVTDLAEVGSVRIASYGADELAGISAQAPDNGFAITIMPAGSACHHRFAAEAASYEGAFLRPTVGWIAGVHLTDIGRATPKVYDGRSATRHDDRAVVAHVTLPPEKMALVEIVNLFEPDNGDRLQFAQAGFDVVDCQVNGETVNFADYVRRRGLEHGRLPLVGDFAGAHLNVSLQSVGPAGGHVQLYAPVFPGVEYHFAKPVADYAGAFRERIASLDAQGAVMSCNCILNFVFGELEGKAIGGVAGPVTFGEIAYQLLNQTLVVVKIV